MTPAARNCEAGTCSEQVRPQISTTVLIAGLSFPEPSSVKARVLAAMLRGNELTHATCWQCFGSSRLAHHILKLRQAGFPVVTESIEVPTCDGRVAHIARYSLPEGFLDAEDPAIERVWSFLRAVRKAAE